VTVGDGHHLAAPLRETWLALDLLPSASPVGLRLGLEAHCLLSVTVQSEEPTNREAVSLVSDVWARLRSACSGAYAAAGSTAMSQDLASS
jgi:hypothetical protein